MKKKITLKKLKKRIHALLESDDFTAAMEEIRGFPARQAINPLISFLFNKDEKIKRKAVKAIGVVVSELADHDMESARVIMRRFMWSLNDESGGIGWAVPEAMAAIMARHEKLAEEYHKILISYSEPGKNYLENEALQKSVADGINRLSAARPELFAPRPEKQEAGD